MYHHVCPEDRVPPKSEQMPDDGWCYNINPNRFETQIRTMMSREYEFLSLEEYVCLIKQGMGSLKRKVVITFDDGWLDNYHYAFPILSKYSIKATFFVVSDLINDAPQSRLMQRKHIVELVKYGMTIGAHTRSHCNLTAISSTAAYEELYRSKSDIEDIIQKKVLYTAYPGGRFNKEIVNLTKRCGYEAACSVIGAGRNTKKSLFWMFRDTLSEQMTSFRNKVLLTPWSRKFVALKSYYRLIKYLYH